MSYTKKRITIFLSEEEEKQVEDFLSPFGGKKGPYAKKALLSSIARDSEAMKQRPEAPNA